MDLIVRFLENVYIEGDPHTNKKYVCSAHIKETYDRFVSLIDFLMTNDKCVELMGRRYLINDYALYYQADEGSLICLDVYVIGV